MKCTNIDLYNYGSTPTPTPIEGTPMIYREDWIPGTGYNDGEVVRKEGYVSVVLEGQGVTYDSPIPTKIGDATYLYNGDIPDTDVMSKQILIGTRYTPQVNIFAMGFRVDVVAGNEYVIYSVEDPLNTKVITQFATFVASTTGWMNIQTSETIIPVGAVFDIIAKIREPAATPTTWNGNWDYDTPNNNTIPLNGQVIHSNSNLELLRINNIDDIGGDRKSELAALVVGDIINIHDSAYAIQKATDNTTYFEFQVSPAVQAGSDGVTEITFETVIATPISFGLDLNYYSGATGVEGLYSESGIYEDIISSDNAYGIDILVQEGKMSDDWHILSHSTGVASASSSNVYTDELISLHLLPTGFDLRVGFEPTLGTIEHCYSAASGIVRVIDHNQVSIVLSGQTTFGDGTTPLADRTMMIRPSDGESEFSYYQNGVKITETVSHTAQHPATINTFFGAFGIDGVFHVPTSGYDAIMKDVACCLTYNNEIEGERILFANERHGLEMDSMTHAHTHLTLGALWSEGLLMTGLTDNGTTFDSMTVGSFFDEDILHSIPEMLTAPFAYREGASGGSWNITRSNITNDLGYQVGSKVQYNNYDEPTDTWSLEPIANDYIAMHFMITNDKENPLIKILGQNLYTTRSIARNRIMEEVSNIRTGSLPTPEFIHIASIIIHDEDVGKIEHGSDSEVWIDMRHQFPVPRFS